MIIDDMIKLMVIIMISKAIEMDGSIMYHNYHSYPPITT